MNDLLQQLGATFGWMSLLQFGGTTAVVPEMHRQAVDVLGWMTPRPSASSSPWPSWRPVPTS